jgi:hypothetical protein
LKNEKSQQQNTTEKMKTVFFGTVCDYFQTTHLFFQISLSKCSDKFAFFWIFSFKNRFNFRVQPKINLILAQKQLKTNEMTYLPTEKK